MARGSTTIKPTAAVPNTSPIFLLNRARPAVLLWVIAFATPFLSDRAELHVHAKMYGWVRQKESGDSLNRTPHFMGVC